MRGRVFLLTLGLSIWVMPATAATLHVPGQYATIQAAIDAAVDGDVVLIAPGTYAGPGNCNLDFGGRLITLRSAQGPESCTVDCGSQRGVLFHSGETRAAVIEGLTFVNGFAAGTAGENGAGMCLVNSSPTIRNCVIQDCFADFCSGGGIYSAGGAPLIIGCRFEQCRAENYMTLDPLGGGALCCLGGAPEIIDNTFRNCHAMVACIDGGGAIRSADATITVRGNVITQCLAHGEGGGIWCTNSQIDIRENTIAHCSGWHAAGGLMVRDCQGILLSNLIAGNQAADICGGGLYVYGGNVEIAFCTIADNSAPGYGGGLCAGNDDWLHDCIVWGNTAYEGAQIYASLALPVAYCDVEGGWTGTGNLDIAPLFADAAAGDYRLTALSGCINMGTPGIGPQPGRRDLDGHARVLCGRGDLGAYEFGIGDYNCDRVVNVADFAGWETCLTGPWSAPSPSGCEALDFEYDGDGDVQDFAAFQRSVGMDSPPPTKALHFFGGTTRLSPASMPCPPAVW